MRFIDFLTRICSKVVLLILVLSVNPGWAQQNDPSDFVDEVATVENYIRSLGLQSRVTEFLELELASELDSAKRQKLAVKLAEAYAAEMFRNPTEETRKLAKNLLAVHPGVREPRLEIALLQFRFQEEVTRFNFAWQHGGLYSSYRHEKWESLVIEFKDSVARLKQEVSDLKIQLEIDPENEVSNRRLKVNSAAELQARYLLGWSLYHLSVADFENRRQHANESDATFRSFFEIAPDKEITEIAENWFAVSNRRNRAALAGWASVARLGNQLPESKFLFSQAKRREATGAITPMELKAQVFAFDFKSAQRVLKEWIAVEPDSPLSAEFAKLAIELSCRSNLREVELADERGQEIEKERRALLDLAATHLLLNQRVSTLLDLEARDCLIEFGDPFVRAWCEALVAFAKFEQSSEQAELGRAHESIQQALELRQADGAASSSDDDAIEKLKLGHCLLLAGKIELRRDNFSLAEKYFFEVPPVTEAISELVVESYWWRAQSGRLSLKGRAGRQQAIERLSELVEKFPNSKWASKASFDLLKMRAVDLPPQETLRQLAAIEEDSEFYPAAQLEKLKCYLRLAVDQASLGEPDQQIQGGDFVAIAGQLINNNEFEVQIRLEASFLLIDYLLGSGVDEKVGKLQTALFSAEQLALKMQSSEVPKSNLLYYRFRILQESGAVAEAYSLAKQLGQISSNPVHRRSAWLFQLQNPQQVATGAESIEVRRRRLELLENLSKSYGNTEADLRNQQNARTAYSKLARSHLAVGDWRSAEKKFERLNQLFPGQSVYLIGLAESKMLAGRMEEATPIWRRLIAGSLPASENWLAAKAGLVEALGQSDPAKAKQVLLQTRQLAPTMPDSWKAKFQALELELEKF